MLYIFYHNRKNFIAGGGRGMRCINTPLMEVKSDGTFLENDRTVCSKNFFFFLNFIFGCVGSSLLTRAFSSCGEQGLLFVAVRGLLTAVASLVVEHGLQAHASVVAACRLSSCGTRAQLICNMCDLPGCSSTLAGGFLTTASPGKSLKKFLNVDLLVLYLGLYPKCVKQRYIQRIMYRDDHQSLIYNREKQKTAYKSYNRGIDKLWKTHIDWSVTIITTFMKNT